MAIHIKLFITKAVALTMFALMQSCKSAPSEKLESDSMERGEPVLVVEDPKFDQDSQSFSLSLRADSTAGAEVTYYLLDGDSILLQDTDGLFNGITPLEEGYNVQARVEWSDTVIVTPVVHVLGFVIPREPVNKLSVQDLQQLINTRNNDTLNKYLAQRIKLVVLESQMKPSLLHDVFLYLEHNVWETVTVRDVAYDENNLITSITLKPVEHIESTTDDDDGGEYFDEY